MKPSKKQLREGRRLVLRFPTMHVIFVSGGDGHYYSVGGRYGIFHMLKHTQHACWEVQSLDEDGRPSGSIDNAEGSSLSDIRRYALRGDFTLPTSRT
jgi:hypothetical protein